MKKMMRRANCAVLCAVAMFAAGEALAAVGDQYVPNGNFEDGAGGSSGYVSKKSGIPIRLHDYAYFNGTGSGKLTDWTGSGAGVVTFYSTNDDAFTRYFKQPEYFGNFGIFIQGTGYIECTKDVWFDAGRYGHEGTCWFLRHDTAGNGKAGVTVTLTKTDGSVTYTSFNKDVSDCNYSYSCGDTTAINIWVPGWYKIKIQGKYTGYDNSIILGAYNLNLVTMGNKVTLKNGGTTLGTTYAINGYAMQNVGVPTATGYTFTGYFTATSGGTQYYKYTGKSAKNWDKSADTTLYAQWSANTSAVTLDRQGGTDGSASVTATYGSAMPAATMPAATGYTFGGYWTGKGGTGTLYYNANGTSARNWDIATATTLYAKWTVNTYTVTLNQQGGTGGSASVTATYNAAMPKATMPARTGYTFGGYFTAANGGGTQYYNANGTSTRNWNLTAATTLYAKWTPNTYAVTLNPQGGSGGAASVTATFNAAMPAAAMPTRTGYTFDGYWSGVGGTGTQFYTAAGAATTATWTTAGVGTLYASWIAKGYPLVLDNGDGTGGNVTATYDRMPPKVTVPKREGMAFRGYYTEPEGAGARVYDPSGVASEAWTTDGGMTLYAFWQEQVAESEELAISADFRAVKPAQVFKPEMLTSSPTGWATDATTAETSDEIGGGLSTAEVAPLPSGYTRVGAIKSSAAQYIDTLYTANRNTKVVFEANIPETNLQPNKWAVLFGSCTAGSPWTYRTFDLQVMDTYRTAIRPTYNGKVYGGTGAGVFSFNEDVTVTYDSTGCYWTGSKAGGLAFDGNPLDKSYSTFYIFAVNGPSVEDGKGAGNHCLMTLYSFKIYEGETVVRDFIPCTNPSGEAGLYDTVTKEFYCNLGSGSFTVVNPASAVTLNANGGSGGTASVTATFGSAMPEIAIPTRTGYSFKGYFDADGKKYYNADGTGAATWDKLRAMTLTAVWTMGDADAETAAIFEAISGGQLVTVVDPVTAPVTVWTPQDVGLFTLTHTAGEGVETAKFNVTGFTYRVEFDANGGTGDAMAGVDLAYGAEGTAPACAYERTDYEFDGWNTRKDGTGTDIAVGGKFSNLVKEAGVTGYLYAQWKVKTAYEFKVDVKEGESDPILEEIKLPTVWLDENLPSEVDKTKPEEVKKELEKTDETGLKTWHKYVLGVDKDDKSAKVWIDSPQQKEKDKIKVKMREFSPTKGTGFTVKYRLDTELNGQAKAKGKLENSPDFDIDVSKGDPTGLYTINVVFVPEGKENSDEVVESVNTMGILKVPSPKALEIVAVPWNRLAPDENQSVLVADLVKTATLTPGDKLHVYDRAKKNYKSWSYDIEKGWVALGTYKLTKAGLEQTTAPDQSEQAVDRGSAVWLERQDASKPFYLYGQYSKDAVATKIEKGTADVPSHNLVASPSLVPFDLNGGKITGTPNAKDQIIVPQGGGQTPKVYTWKSGNGWGYTKIVNGRLVFYTEDAQVPAGTGFWYISKGGSPTIKW